jgi:hypothetical protein
MTKKTSDVITLTKERPDPSAGRNFTVVDTVAQAEVTHSCLGHDPRGQPRRPADLMDARMVVATAMASGLPRKRFMILWDAN